ncbi:Daple [Krasilnikovia sp. MM14-A1259]|uniref:Daple n=1 Tax=Krasilnikovia sp. MM14-A1259 TaxID=3373539 RepID=UPI0037FED1D5
MDETGQSGDTGAVMGGPGAESRDRARVNGWSGSDSAWSSAGAALDPEEGVPAWRRPFTRPFGQRAFPASRAPLPPGHSSGDFPLPDAGPTPFADAGGHGELPAFGDAGSSGDVRAFGDAGSSGEIRPSETGAEQSGPAWSEGRSRYADLFAHRTPQTVPPEDPRPDSAPPFPYEGDLDDALHRDQTRAPQQRSGLAERPTRAIFPAVRPATPGGRRVDWTTAESARHARDPGGQVRPSDDQDAVRPSYDPGGFPGRLTYESDTPPATAAPSPDSSAGYGTSPAYPGWSGRSVGEPGAEGGPLSGALPQRVPAEPDVPTVPEPPSVEPSAETPALARIATHLRRGDVLAAEERQEGFDVQAILAAVREVAGVRDASLRTTPAGAHSLRLDLADGADPAEVSRQVARLLQDRMGLDAAMQGGETPAPPASAPASAPPAVPFVPSQPTSAARDVLGPPPSSARDVLGPPPSSAGRDALGPPPPPAASAGHDVLDGPLPPARPVDPLPLPPEPSRSAEAPIAGAPPPITPMSAPPASVLSMPPALPTFAPSQAVERAAYAPPGGPVDVLSTGINGATPRPLDIGDRPGPRVVIENVQVSTFGTEATVEVRLAAGNRIATGEATGPAVDGYLMRLCAMATARAVDELLSASRHADGPARCFVEHAAAVPFGAMQVAVVVLLLSCGGWVEQLAGSAVVVGDDRHAMVRATLAAVNRRLEALLS